ncbi:MAG: hypothetical protein GY841_12435 [FCB group bacterium]|nr:hypothetical protein [FCB group bacterium]
MRLGTAYVEIKAKYDNLKKGLKKARGEVTDSVGKMNRKIRDISFNIPTAAVAAFGVAVVYSMKKSIDAASDLEEAASKFSVVFKGQTALAEKWTKTLVASYAMSTREAKQYLSSVQDLLVPMGMQADAAAKMSNEVVKLSADLGSFNNLDTAQVMNDIQSALVGNFETMKKYGVVLNATVVSEKALEMGLAATKKELTAGMKAQAAYALMVEGSKAAIGDMALTSEGYANQTKLLQASLENLSASLGAFLIPAAKMLVGVLNDLIRATQWLIENELGFDSSVIGAMEKTQKAILSDIAAREKLIERGRDTKERGYSKDLTARKEELALLKIQLSTIEKTIAAEKERTKAAAYNATPSPVSPTPSFAGGGGGFVVGGDYTKEQVDQEKAILDEIAANHLAWRDYELAEILSDHEAKMALQADFAQRQIDMDNATNAAIMAGEADLTNQKKAEDVKRRKIAQAGGKQALKDAQFIIGEMGKQSKAGFELFKAASTAIAIVKGIEATQSAFAAGNATGIPGMGVVFAAAAAAAAAARVSAIQSTSFSGGGSISAGGGGYSSSVGTYQASPYTGLPETTTAPESQAGPTINFIVHGNIVADDEEQVTKLMDRFNELVEDKGYELNASTAIELRP